MFKANFVIKLNEYIDKFSEIKPHLDEACNSLQDEIEVYNDGCARSLALRAVRYLESHGFRVTLIESNL